MTAVIDLALAYDPATRRCDHVFDGTDFALDGTAMTPVLMAIGLDRRAHADDDLPDATTDDYAPGRLNSRRGWCGDALDPLRRLTGSRLWLLRRRKQDEPTRLLAESALTESLDPLARARGWPISIMVRWVQEGVLGYQVSVGDITLPIRQAVA